MEMGRDVCCWLWHHVYLVKSGCLYSVGVERKEKEKRRERRKKGQGKEKRRAKGREKKWRGS
jgi:hypothetical protein